MEHKITLFSAPDPEMTRNAVQLLQSLPDVSVEIRPETKLLEGRVLLPFIETSSGERYCGDKSIRRFVDDELAKINHNGNGSHSRRGDHVRG